MRPWGSRWGVWRRRSKPVSWWRWRPMCQLLPGADGLSLRVFRSSSFLPLSVISWTAKAVDRWDRAQDAKQTPSPSPETAASPLSETKASGPNFIISQFFYSPTFYFPREISMFFTEHIYVLGIGEQDTQSQSSRISWRIISAWWTPIHSSKASSNISFHFSMLFISCHFLKDSLHDHVSFSVALWGQTLFCLRTFTGADAATSNSSNPSFPNKPYSLFRTQDPWTLPSRPVRCSRSPRHSVSFYSVLFDSCPSPSLECTFHMDKKSESLFIFAIVGLVCGGLSVYICKTDPSSRKSSLISSVSLPSANFSSLSFLSYFVCEFLKSRIFTHRGKCIKYVYSLTNNYKANTNLRTTQVKI